MIAALNGACIQRCCGLILELHSWGEEVMKFFIAHPKK